MEKDEIIDINLNNIEFERSVSNLSGLPDPLDYEIVLAGKSNVGKSSFINSIFKRKKLAKTSNTPGKTRQLNFYNLDKKAYIVDLPGYGYSKMSKMEETEISNRINHYLVNRHNISLIIHILDIRHMPTEKDIHMFDFIKRSNIPFIIILNKADKLKQKEIDKNLEEIKKVLGISFSPIFVYSSAFKGDKLDEFQKPILNEINNILLGKI